MNSPSDRSPLDPLDSPQIPAMRMAETHPLFWSVRRELWENRSIYLAPLIVAALVLFGTLISTATVPKRVRTAGLDPAKQRAAIVRPFAMAPAPIMLATFLVGFFYAIDALYGERRDRSILFWKSLPVSDRTTVLSKAAIPLLVLPLIAFALSLATQLILIVPSSMILAGNRLSPAPLWVQLQFFEGPMIMIYGLAVHALWFAPVYGWLLLVSAWARRVPLLWAVLPPLAVGAVERIAFNTKYFLNMLGYRVTGAMNAAFSGMGHDGNVDNTHLEPLRFLTTAGLWVGLIFAAACLAAAVRLRRNREPI